MGEDMMGKMRGLTAASAKGLRPWDVNFKALTRYCYALDTLFEEPEKWLRFLAKHKV